MAKNSDPTAQATTSRAKAVSDARAVMEKQNAEYYAREAAARPTPTQEENDLARVGALDIDRKAEDGSEAEVDALRRQAESRLPGGGAYDTRIIDTSASATAKRSNG
jgi:hypothetical protein